MDIYLLGVGRNTPVYIDLIETCGYKVAGLLHYNSERIGEKVLGYPIIDANDNFFENNSLKGLNFAISVGDNMTRIKLAGTINRLGGQLPNLIHPSAVVSKHATIAKGVVIHANSVVQAGAKIGANTVISYNSSVTHTSTIGKGCYLAAGSNIGAYITINDNVLIGQEAVLVSAKVKCIGENAVIGAGAVVINDVEPNAVIIGNPGKVLTYKK